MDIAKNIVLFKKEISWLINVFSDFDSNTQGFNEYWATQAGHNICGLQ